MVEHISDEAVVEPVRYNGHFHSRNGLCEMALSTFRKQGAVLDMLVSNGKELSGVKEIKKVTSVWKLFMLILLGACGLYMCLIGVDHRVTSQQSFLSSHPMMDYEGACTKNSRSPFSDIPEHFPRPQKYDRGECACTSVHYFAILSMQRSGSGWFETLLNDHPNISSHGEIFSVKPRRENLTTIIQTLDAIYNLDWVSSAAKNECTAAVGLKWMLNQGVMEYNREVSAYFKRKGVSVILLVRRNMLKRLISILANAYDRRMKPLNGTHKSHVHSHEEAKTLAKYKPVINVKHLPDNLRRVQEITDDALHFFNGTRLALVYYEDLVRNPKSIETVQEFLGVPARKLESRQVKIHTKPLQEQIENWEEVLTRLKGTEFESFLEDNDYSK
ncbi:hypothetical protein MPTK1_6g11500 [Marchantia polymorpha subsp. ruderalis]|uniref:Sulfotransferase n=2 Tax=Marchantia polymorpha TaxID=3197 RepID=A0A176WE72_MARPO|nr:hypothetical protein AXG93_4188s1050 [Marchantia polymorpha subsp. ruderalis]PTQ45149.1 hypothetical protein MARPO_0016s0189 [Marchantia polymorpha]BBN14416.1 hypothetical protein Mp_6g11500 [Marchantia polymorpha subsp. ruderalis]|eukprot:PTQ45149.1 hypothetical protein MARPO_0016s0189 [Marchantia polymorpha]